MNHYAVPEWHKWLVIALIGALFIAAGIAAMIIQFAVSIRDREANRDLTGDPWNGRSLEWSTASPAPFYNFAHVPVITSLEQHWDNKEAGRAGKCCCMTCLLPAPTRKRASSRKAAMEMPSYRIWRMC